VSVWTSKKALGIKIGLVGFLVAIGAVPVRLFLSHDGGFWLAAVGIAIGFVGIGLHFARLFFGTDEVV
jgi:hypothetical protein